MSDEELPPEFPGAELETNFDYFDAGMDIAALDDLDVSARATVLDRLGPAHFRSKGFSFMGFLQTVYDHIAEHTGSAQPTMGTDIVVESSAPPVVEAELIEPAPDTTRTDFSTAAIADNASSEGDEIADVDVTKVPAANPFNSSAEIEDEMSEEESLALDRSMPKNERRM